MADEFSDEEQAERMAMVTKILSIQRETIETSPVYHRDTTMIRLDNAIVTENGTQAGRSTVDLQCVDPDGNKYVIMITGALLRTLAIVIKEADGESNGAM